MTGPTIGYATLPIIPSVRGLSQAISSQIAPQAAAAGHVAGNQVGQGMLASVRGHAAAAGRALASTFTAATAATAGLAVAAARTGTAYNQLEQSAGAAFSTLLGSRGEATAFMGELREFAQSSPFPRQAFIEGAQQLVAFGYEAEKVVPALDAIQDAVAASGGSAQQLSEVTFVLAQIQAAGKITATDLMQLGQRGINAADLIGSQMGMAGAQVKEAITAGTLDAGEAIDALVAGMSDRFGGAAEGLKDTWVGSVDRIKGAWRDISSDLVEPFIAKQGGGAAIEWANQLAATLRSLQAGPVKDLAGWLDKSADSMGRLVTAALDIGWIDNIGRLVGSAKELGPLLGAASGALGVIGSTHLPVIGSHLPMVNPVLAAVVGLVAASPEARAALADVAREVGPLVASLAERLAPSLENIAEIISGTLPTGIQLVGTGLELILTAANALAPVLEWVTGLLADHQEIVMLAALAYAAFKAQAAGAALVAGLSSAATAVTGMTKAVLGLRAAMVSLAATQGVTTLTASLGVLRASLMSSVSAAGAAGGALAGIAVGAGAATYALNKLHESGDRDASAWLGGLEPPDLSTLDGALDRVNEINARIQELRAEMDSGSTNRFDDEKLAAEINALTAAYDALQPSVLDTARGMGALRDETGLTVDQIEGLARSAGVELTDAFDSTGRPTRDLQAQLDDVAAAADTARVDLQSIEMTPEQIEKLQADAKAIEEAMAAAGSAFKSSFDVLTLTDESVDPKQVAAAEKAVERAKEQLADAEKAAGAAGQTADEQERSARALRDAKEHLGDAVSSLDELRASDSPLNGDKIREWYEGALTEAATFNENIHKALQEGYDPAFVQRLLAAGPEQAGPILETLVASATDAFVEMVNSAEKELGELTAFTTESARLTQQAINETGTKGQEMAKLLETAIGISHAQMRSSAALSIEDLATLTRSEVGEVRRAMELFGLELETVQTRVAAVKAQIMEGFDGSGIVSWGMITGGGSLQGGRASGGPVWPGSWLVGEHGPEIITMSGQGHVYDAAETSRMLGGDGGRERRSEAPRPSSGGGTLVIQTVDTDRAVERGLWEGLFS